MKKLLVLGLGLCACVASAGLTFESGKAVGFSTVALTSDYTILTVPFADCLTGGEIALDKLVSTSGLTGSNDAAAADQLIVFADGTYSYYYLNADNAWTALKGVVAGADTTELPPAIAEQKLAKGYGVWLKKQNATSAVQLKGRVADGQETIIATGMNLIGNGYPTALDLNAVKWPSDVSQDEILVAAPAADDPTAAGSYLTYRMNGGKWMKRTLDKSGKIPGTNIPLTKEVWSEIDPIPAGSGFWYRRVGESFTFDPGKTVN